MSRVLLDDIVERLRTIVAHTESTELVLRGEWGRLEARAIAAEQRAQIAEEMLNAANERWKNR